MTNKYYERVLVVRESIRENYSGYINKKYEKQRHQIPLFVSILLCDLEDEYNFDCLDEENNKVTYFIFYSLIFIYDEYDITKVIANHCQQFDADYELFRQEVGQQTPCTESRYISFQKSNIRPQHLDEYGFDESESRFDMVEVLKSLNNRLISMISYAEVCDD